jgi:hypothetical protein
MKWCVSNGLIQKMPSLKLLREIVKKVYHAFCLKKTSLLDDQFCEDTVLCFGFEKALSPKFKSFITKDVLLVMGEYIRVSNFSDYKLSANWGSLMPWFYLVLKESEEWLRFCGDEKLAQTLQNRLVRGVKLFHLCPQNTLSVRHVHLSIRSIRFIGISLDLWNSSVQKIKCWM